MKNLEKNMAKLTIEVSAEEFEKALQNAYLKEQKKNSVSRASVRVKFRVKLIEKMYGTGRISTKMLLTT